MDADTTPRRPRVALGPTDVAGTASALAYGLREHGVDAEVVVWRPAHPFGFPADRALGRAGRAAYALALPLRRDVVHLQYGTSWLPRALDARWARAWGRTVVVAYHGDDCRRESTLAQCGWPLSELGLARDDAGVVARLRRLAAVADAAVVADLELLSYVREFFARVYVVPSPVGAIPRPRRAEVRSRLVVLHAPSDPKVKGTEVIATACERVRARHDLEFRLLTGVPHADVRAALQSADVLVDQLYSASASVLALEALGHGVPVLSRVDRRAFASFHETLPIVPVTAESLEDELESLVRDAPRRRELGERGRAYVGATHTATGVAGSTLRVYEHARAAAPGVYEATAGGIVRRDD